MKKQNSQMLGDYALLANFAYAEIDQTFKNNQLQTDNIVNILMTRNEGMSGSIKGNVTRSQAEHIASNYNIIAHWKDGVMGHGFSGTLFRNKNSNEYVLALRGSNPADFPSNIADIGVQGVNYEQVVDLYNFTKLLTSNNKGYTAVKLTEDVKLNQMISELKQIELIIKHAIDTPENRERYNQLLKEIEKEKSKSIDGQLINKDTADNIFLDEISRIRLPEGVKIPEGTKFTVVGHSLGGHLAMSFARLFPELTNHAYSFNGAGFGNFSGNEVDKFFNLLLDKESSFNPEILSSIISYKGREFTAMDDGHLKQVISPHYVFTNESAHGIKELVDSMSAISFIATLDKRFADLSLSEIFEPEGKEIEKSQINAKPITKILESLSYDDNQFFGLFVQKMFRILKGKDYTGDLDHDKFHKTLFDLKDDLSKNIGFEKGSFTISAVHDIPNFLEKALSPDGYAYRYALKHLNPFVIEHKKLYAPDGVLKDELPSLEFYNYDVQSEKGMTWDYVHERTKMLLSGIHLLLSSEKGDKEKIFFEDIHNDNLNTENIIETAKKEMPDPINKKHTLFLSDDEKISLKGKVYSYPSVKIFGGKGDDDFYGTKNMDYFEGGIGNDTYRIDGHDMVHDVDGKGKVLIKNVHIHDHFFYISENMWETKDKEFIAIREGSSLKLIKANNQELAATFFDFFNPKFEKETYFEHLGIVLEKEALPEEDPKPKYEVEGIEGKNNTFFSSGEYVKFIGGNLTDRVVGSMKEGMIAELGDGSDIFTGNIKKDIVWGNAGYDVLIGSSRNEENIDDPDYIEGGEGRDLINGGSGDDNLYADSKSNKILNNYTNIYLSHDFSDWVVGGMGNDNIFGSALRDILMGGGHRDAIYGGAGSDLIFGDGQLLFDYKHIIPAIISDIPVTNEFTFDSKTKTWFSDKDKGFYYFKIKEESFNWSFNVSYENKKSNYEIATAIPMKEEIHLDEKGDTDYIDAGQGDDFVLGQKGNDVMFMGAGNDIAYGDDYKDLSISGDDYMNGGDGFNQLFGGKGNDIYAITWDSYNIIDDIEGKDKLDISGYNFSEFTIHTIGTSLLIFSQINNIYVQIENWENKGIEQFIFHDQSLNLNEIKEKATVSNDPFPPFYYQNDPYYLNDPSNWR